MPRTLPASSPSSLARRSDAPLAARHRTFGEIVARFQDMAFGCAFALLGDYQLAEDAAQEAFLCAYQRLDQFRDPIAFPGWLQQIVRTQCHRKLRVRHPILGTLTDDLPSSSAGPEESAIRGDRRHQVADALAALPEVERLVVVLFYVREYSLAEVAAFLGISAISVKKRLASARGRLKERLIDMVQDDLHERRPSNRAAFAKQLMAFTRLFSAFIDQGKSLVRSLVDLGAGEEDPAFRAVIDDINQEIQSGNILSRAMAKHPDYFGPAYIAVIYEGEVGGNLEVALARLAGGEVEPDSPSPSGAGDLPNACIWLGPGDEGNIAVLCHNCRMPPSTIRIAEPADAAAIQAIYAPYIRDTVISFEVEPPTVDEMRARIENILPQYPWLVCERDGEVVGYVYACANRARAAYIWSVDVAVYIRAEAHRLGIGRALYTSLFEILRLQGFYNAYAGITLPNAGSVGLHESFGFQRIGVFHSVGYKFGAWHDVGWWQMALKPHAAEPAQPLSLDDAMRRSGWQSALETGQPLLIGR